MLQLKNQQNKKKMNHNKNNFLTNFINFKDNNLVFFLN